MALSSNIFHKSVPELLFFAARWRYVSSSYFPKFSASLFQANYQVEFILGREFYQWFDSRVGRFSLIFHFPWHRHIAPSTFRERVRLVVDFTNISLSLIIAQIHIIWRRPLWTGILFGLSMDLLPKLPHYLSPGGVRKATKFVVSNPPLCLSLWTSPVEGGVWRSFVEQEQE